MCLCVCVSVSLCVCVVGVGVAGVFACGWVGGCLCGFSELAAVAFSFWCSMSLAAQAPDLLFSRSFLPHSVPD